MSRIEDLYQQGKQEQSPAPLDNLILSAAKQSCKETKAPSRRKTWLYALPSAAVVIMSLSIILNLQHENQEIMTTPDLEIMPVPKASSPAKLKSLDKTHKPTAVNTKNQVLKDDINQANPSISATTVGAIQAQNKPQKPTQKLEKKRNSSSNTVNAVAAPVYEEAINETVVEDDRDQDLLMEQETHKETTTNSKLIYQQQSKFHTKRQIYSSLQIKIKTLKALIAEKKIKQAQELLKTLKTDYPEQNFNEFARLISQM